MCTVSVIIPTFNRAHTLCRAVNSVLNQTFRDLEVIIVDDDSKDNTEEILRKFNDPRVVYVKHKSNRGAGAARNTGIKNAEGKYIAFLDSDDEWLPVKLEKQLKKIEQANNRVGLVYTGFSVLSENGRKILDWTPKIEGKVFDRLLEGNYLGTTSTVLLRRECFDEVGFFDESLKSCQDWDMWIRVAKKYEFRCIPEPLVKYYIMRDSISKALKKRFRGHLAVFRKCKKYVSQDSYSKIEYYFKIAKLTFIRILWATGEILLFKILR